MNKLVKQWGQISTSEQRIHKAMNKLIHAWAWRILGGLAIWLIYDTEALGVWCAGLAAAHLLISFASWAKSFSTKKPSGRRMVIRTEGRRQGKTERFRRELAGEFVDGASDRVPASGMPRHGR